VLNKSKRKKIKKRIEERKIQERDGEAESPLNHILE